MRHSLPIAPQFYVTAPQPCPYLEGRLERKLFTALSGDSSRALNDTLSKQGFRRSQNVLYRPACSECSACLSARIRVADFQPSRSQRRTLKRNAALSREATSPWATDEQFTLFRRYLDSRHADGGMADMDVFEFAAMIEETPVRSRVVEYTEPRHPLGASVPARGSGRALTAVCLTDVLDDGLSLVYSFYEPERVRDGLGTYMILDHIELARQVGLPYVYLGYWVPGSAKMAYKAGFSALEVYHDGVWSDLDAVQADVEAPHPLAVRPITDQVAAICLPPDSMPGLRYDEF
ncbi:arginyltransferase [Pararhodobacter oceanensis]|uniref:Aspartate/glutamate leucyltransferase n=1 Tax=Pararhodobacter oceanensis TaxID=2172121 RepID=A0A2T8HT72_9RHOB|nr:arginyltransferase [Pararhodobacter oceanensis]PVH28649.1 arginyltransferase [Pararhodobacter oceanensis]